MAAPTVRPKEAQIIRQERYVSHALVEVRKYRFLPVAAHSAVLLDISLNGFKLEFTSEVSISPGHQYWLNIPLSPLGIYSPKRLICKCECRWFDHNRFRIGGVFTNLSRMQKTIIEQAISGLRSKKSI